MFCVIKLLHVHVTDLIMRGIFVLLTTYGDGLCGPAQTIYHQQLLPRAGITIIVRGSRTYCGIMSNESPNSYRQILHTLKLCGTNIYPNIQRHHGMVIDHH